MTRKRIAASLAITTLACAAGLCQAQVAEVRPGPPAPPVKRYVTQGLATQTQESVFTCRANVVNLRKSGVGTITATDGTVLTVPAVTAFAAASKLGDLFNECNAATPARLGETRLQDVPIVEVDADGEVVTGYLVADNYFELYVNGKLIGVDAVPYTPFNSSVVRFRVKKPYTYAVKLVDWEEKLGVGMEWFPPNFAWYTGDGGFIARFSDGVVTDSSWKAQAFYISPLAHPDDVLERGNLHDTTALGRVHPHAKQPTCREKCFAVHYPIPAAWADAAFDDAAWPRAYEYTDEDIGVNTLTAYTRFPEAFSGARWIWSLNLVFDNLVLARKTVR